MKGKTVYCLQTCRFSFLLRKEEKKVVKRVNEIGCMTV